MVPDAAHENKNCPPVALRGGDSPCIPHADGLFYRLLYVTLLAVLIPGVTYFMQASLRRAKADVVDPEEEIHIVIRNLVKIYPLRPASRGNGTVGWRYEGG